MRELPDNAYTAHLEFHGESVLRLIRRLQDEGVRLLVVKPVKDYYYIVIPERDLKKFFAICEKMCYNIRIEDKIIGVRERKNRPLVRLLGRGGAVNRARRLASRIGITVGVAVFVVFCYLLDGTLLGYDLKDVPVQTRSGVVRALKDNGAEIGRRFSSLDLTVLSSAVVEGNADVSFASVSKHGSFLSVSTVPMTAGEALPIADILSPVKGKIVKMAVLRGTQLASVGDEVEEGTPLVGAYFTAGEERISTRPVADIIVQTEYALSIKTTSDSPAGRLAVLQLAKEKCPISQIIAQNVTANKSGNDYIITATLTCLVAIGG